MMVVEKYCCSCGTPVDAPTDEQIRDADEIVEKETDEHCGCEYDRDESPLL